MAQAGLAIVQIHSTNLIPLLVCVCVGVNTYVYCIWHTQIWVMAHEPIL